VFLCLVTCSYTLVGGLGAVVVTDAVQTVLMLSAGLLVAFLTFSQPEIGGFFGLLSLDASAPAAQQKMHLYLPSAHPDLPWSGALTGLVFLHFFYWTTNQYLVQRTLAARSDEDARVGVLAAGFLKLTIPFFSTACGVAGGYLFRQRLASTTVLPDDAFLHLVDLVVPVGYGLTGLIIAGITAATFSSIDSMMNSASTLFTLDIYKKYLRPQASDRALVRTGRITVVTLAVLGGLLALVTYDPGGAGNFFLGVFWPRASLRGAVATMAAAPVFGVLAELLYDRVLADVPAIAMVLGSRLNFLHRVCAVALACSLVHVVVSRRWPDRTSRATAGLVAPRLPWQRIGLWGLTQLVLIACIHVAGLSPRAAAVPAAATTLLVFLAGAPYRHAYNRWAGLLSAVTIALLYAFA
jgi:SSS family solute:Na+ symporter